MYNERINTYADTSQNIIYFETIEHDFNATID